MFVRRYSEQQEQEMEDLFLSGNTLASLTREYGGCVPTVRDMLKRRGVWVRRPGGHSSAGGAPQRTWSSEDIDEMVRRWVQGDSKSSIAIQFGTTDHIVMRELRKRGIYNFPHRPNAPRGEKHGRWNGGRTLNSDGYVRIRCPDGMYRGEHRLVMEGHLGRSLTKAETVHHINGDKADNRIENLQLRQGRHGNGIALRCKNCQSRDLEPVPLA